MANYRNGLGDPDLAFRFIEANRSFQRHDEAMNILRRLASFVKPIMRKRGWQVGTLAEFYPPQANLLGVNQNHGERICLRLRHHNAINQFMPFEAITDTLLHELSHIVRGPHDAIFHKQWNELRDEAEQLLYSGFTGEAFLGKGQQLGGRGATSAERERLARAEALKRRSTLRSQGHVLGGRVPMLPRGNGMRDAIATAADRRAAVHMPDGCGSGTKEGIQAAEEASRLGFASKQEMDDANEVAIQRALIELMEEDRQKNGGGRPMSEGLTWTPEAGLSFEEPIARPSSTPGQLPPPVPGPSTRPSAYNNNKPLPKPPVEDMSQFPRSATQPPQTPTHQRPARPVRKPVSRLVAEDEARRRREGRGHVEHPTAPASRTVATKTSPVTWTCNICTLVNQPDHLICDACGTERPGDVGIEQAHEQLSSIPVSLQSPTAAMTANNPWGWNCGRCGSFMENQWWTCSACGLMKASS